ncbi:MULTISPECIES: glycosyltransferase [unclassified Pseudoalteromonas]|uniref:glycosyltransferase n=1 Tax=unclassified Pseudoalteromonas TaxID=194690 RepID=UPI002096A152|nr:glycosyltransferase [Pseudoalteromonas sp. XMcav2-N]MCO7188743.1 glycosyltransferase [Pseudoalteromonas sp. XMcav2-N]
MNKEKLDISLIITTYNEEKSIAKFCKSIIEQTFWPAQIVLVDSISKDDTVRIFRESLSCTDIELKVIEEKCNISQGRNLAIGNADFEKVAVTDAGVALVDNWLHEIYTGLEESDIVSGYYEYTGENLIQKSYKRLFYKPSERIDGATFNPSSRSLGLHKYAWEAVGGYDESFAIGEDTDFDIKMRKAGFSFLFKPSALVAWDVRDTFKALFLQHFRYSKWDARIGQNQTGHVIFITWFLVIMMSLILAPFTIIPLAGLFLISTAISVKKCGKFHIEDIAILNLCYMAKGIGYVFGKIFK